MKIEIELADDLMFFQVLNAGGCILVIKSSNSASSGEWPEIIGLSPVVNYHRVLTVRQLIRLSGKPMPVQPT